MASPPSFPMQPHHFRQHNMHPHTLSQYPIPDSNQQLHDSTFNIFNLQNIPYSAAPTGTKRKNSTPGTRGRSHGSKRVRYHNSNQSAPRQHSTAVLNLPDPGFSDDDTDNNPSAANNAPHMQSGPAVPGVGPVDHLTSHPPQAFVEGTHFGSLVHNLNADRSNASSASHIWYFVHALKSATESFTPTTEEKNWHTHPSSKQYTHLSCKFCVYVSNLMFN
ncbi:hypothetical protein EV368DRAFT_90374 [Lentinula lateritia]|nr:hypothetical protein EV368DRAFT_90374 [Lentinula lateritia]